MLTRKSIPMALLFCMALLPTVPLVRAETCSNGTVTLTNSAIGYADVELFLSSGETRRVKIAKGQTQILQLGETSACPSHLQGAIRHLQAQMGILKRCMKSNAEGWSVACPEADCGSSNWIIQGGGGSFHFFRQ